MTEYTFPPLRRFVEQLCPWVVLIIIATYTFAKFVRVPYPGFLFSNTGQVVEIYTEPGASDSLRIGDQLIQVGDVAWTDFEANPRLELFDGAQPDSVIPLRVRRDGQVLSVSWAFAGPTGSEVMQRLNSQWWLPYVFWLAGMLTVLLIRPRDTRWWLLIGFNLLTAIWLVAGSVSLWKVWESRFVLRSALWLSVPVYWHLHWSFPRPLGRLPLFLLWLGYLAAAALAVTEWFQLVPGNAFQFAFLMALGGSLVLLLIRFIIRPVQRRELGLLGGAVLLVLVPPIGVALATIAGLTLPFFIQGGAILALPAIPGAYFYTLFRRRFSRLERRTNRLVRLYSLSILFGTLILIALAIITGRPGFSSSTFSAGLILIFLMGVIAIVGFAPFLSLATLAAAYEPTYHPAGGMEIRANRLLAPYLFFVLLSAVIAAAIVSANAWLNFPGAAILVGIVSAILAGVLTATYYTRFARFVETRLLGIPLPPAQLLHTFAERITSSLDGDNLTRLLTKEVLPTLLIRQSALLYFTKTQSSVRSVDVIYAVGVETNESPNAAEITALLYQAGKYRLQSLSNDAPQPCPWVRLALPLNLNGRAIGLWLLGRRDPDNLYSREDITTLQALADQTAIALSNILQAESLRALYEVSVNRQEDERVRLARVLHDEVLNQLAALKMEVDEEAAGPHFQAVYESLTTNIRQEISGLRPAMLIYGLAAALEELVDDLIERTEGEANIELDLPPTTERYPTEVEQHLFRIVQQAVENALQHAQAETICIGGRLGPERVELSVVDDGHGFPIGRQPDLATLLANKHFGLAGMFERAELIQASLDVESTPGYGTRVTLLWATPDDPSSETEALTS